MPTWFAR
jgi:hypothetical protein